MEEEKDETAMRLLVEAFKDTESVILGLMYEMAKVVDLLVTVGSSRSALVANTSLEVALKDVECQEGRQEGEVVAHAFQRLAIILQKGNAKILLNRIPHSTGGPIDGDYD